VAQLIGFPLAVPLDVEMQQPGEGEITAARRLLDRLVKNYGRFFDAVGGDALYLEGPFFNLCQSHGKHVIAVLKANTPALLADAQDAFARRKALVRQEEGQTIYYWDEEGFTSAQSIEAPLRVLHTVETSEQNKILGGNTESQTQIQEWWWATTIPQSLIPSRQLRQIGHQRWHIENRLFHSLTTHWGLDHCYRHDPTAIINFVLTFMIAFIVLQAFFLRNLKPHARAHLSLIELSRLLLTGLRQTFRWPKKSQVQTSTHPPP